MPEPVRIFIVEDDADVRAGLARLLRGRPELLAAGEFSSGEVALRAVGAGLAADVALVDLALPGMQGPELIRRLRTALPALDVVVLTVFGDTDHVFAALSAGASGYLLKDVPPESVVDGVLEVARGGAPMSPSIARRVVERFRRRTARDNPLTAREQEVLALLMKGATYPQIGRALDIGTGTVQCHIKAIYRKLEVSTKAEATAEAYKRGLVTD